MTDPTEALRKTTRIRELVGRLADGGSAEDEAVAAEIYDTITALEYILRDSESP